MGGGGSPVGIGGGKLPAIGRGGGGPPIGRGGGAMPDIAASFIYKGTEQIFESCCDRCVSMLLLLLLLFVAVA